MSHDHQVCKRHLCKSRMPIERSRADEPGAPAGDRGYFSPLNELSTNHVQTTVLLSFDGALDNQSGRSIRSHVRDLLDLGIRSIFLDLSGVAGVDATGVCHLMETLDDASALGGGVAVLEASDALAAYFRDM
jgi:anti-anti-sigma factor